MITIRSARPDDGPRLQEIDRLAGERFREVGMDKVADDDPPSLDSLAAYAISSRSWVAVDDADGTVVGFVLVDVVDEAAHVEQISVPPERQGEGVGRALLDHVAAFAGERGLAGITLTTFAEIPWNRPLYEHLGFRVLDEAEIGPELRSLREIEATHGLDPTNRVCMRRSIS